MPARTQTIELTESKIEVIRVILELVGKTPARKGSRSEGLGLIVRDPIKTFEMKWIYDEGDRRVTEVKLSTPGQVRLISAQVTLQREMAYGTSQWVAKKIVWQMNLPRGRNVAGQCYLASP